MSRGHIAIEDVVKVYDPEGAAVMAVDHCSLEIEAGEICMIVGPSGCGKTTLLNAIAGFHDITSGRIVMDGEVLCSSERPKADPGPDRIVVFQNGALFPWKTNLENVIFGPMMQGKLTRAQAEERINDPFDLFGNGSSRHDRGHDRGRPQRPVRGADLKQLHSLGLDETATPDQVKAQYKTLVKRLHPDANGGSRANEDKLREIIQAYGRLRETGFC